MQIHAYFKHIRMSVGKRTENRIRVCRQEYINQ